jgi:hypothetical protein
MNLMSKNLLDTLSTSLLTAVATISALGTLLPAQAQAQSDGSVNLFSLAWDASVFVWSATGWVLMSVGDAINRGFSTGYVPGSATGTGFDWQAPATMGCVNYFKDHNWNFQSIDFTMSFPIMAECSQAAIIFSTNPALTRRTYGVDISKPFFSCRCF